MPSLDIGGGGIILYTRGGYLMRPDTLELLRGTPMEKLTMNISGMTCGHCVGQVTKALKSLDGVQVEQVKVGLATVAYDPSRTSPDQLAQAVEDAGYVVRPVQLGRAPKSGSER
jgi:copper chaperone